jgi:hypothetical protein
LTAQLDPEAKTETAELTTGANREKTLCHGGSAMLAKNLKTDQHQKAKPGEKPKTQRINA